jgi:CheY-like chemotaxis protein
MREARRPRDYLDDPELLPPRILLAEDDVEMRALVSGDLRRAGYSVVECADGAALLRRLEAANGTEGLGVDLVVADVRMPELTGLEVLERLRGVDPFTPYIVVTVFGSAETRRIARRLGAAAVLDKPFEVEDLLHLVEDAIGSPPDIGPEGPGSARLRAASQRRAESDGQASDPEGGRRAASQRRAESEG